MKKTISKEQYEELKFLSCIDDKGYHEKLEEIGVDVRPYRAYQYFDEYGNYKGDSDDMSVDDILDAMDISVEEEKKPKKICERCDYCQYPRSSDDNWGACKCQAMKRKTIDVSVAGGQVPDWCPLNKEDK